MSLAVASWKNVIIRPSDENQTKVAFYRIAGLPGVIGAIDCTHVRIQAPSEHEADYVNRQGYHSIHVQAVADASGKLVNVVAQWPGQPNTARKQLRQGDERAIRGQWFFTG